MARQTDADRGDGEWLRLFATALMPAGDRVTGPAQVVREVLFHLYRRLERHRVQVLVKLRGQVKPEQ